MHVLCLGLESILAMYERSSDVSIFEFYNFLTSLVVGWIAVLIFRYLFFLVLSSLA